MGSLPIYLFLISFVFVVLASVNTFKSDKLFRRKLQDKLVDRTYFRRSIQSFLHRIYRRIINFKTDHNYYTLSEFEQSRRSNILERYYFNHDEEVDYKLYDAKNTIKSIVITVIFIISTIIIYLLLDSFVFFRGYIVVYIAALYYVNSLRYKKIESYINQENLILNRNFGDFFLVQYKIIKNKKKKPIEKGLKANLVVTKNETMLKFINNFLYIIESEGEELAIERMIRWYNNIHYLNRFLIIEQQIVRGANAETDIMGLRTEVLKDKEDLIEEKCYAIIRESNIIVWLAIFLTIQVSIGALAYVVQQSGLFK